MSANSAQCLQWLPQWPAKNMDSKPFLNKWKDSSILSGGGLTKLAASGRQEIWFKILYSESLFYRAGRKLTAAQWGSLYLAYLTASWATVTGSHTGQRHWSPVLCSFLHGLFRSRARSSFCDMSGTCEPSPKAACTAVCSRKIHFSKSMCIRITWVPLWKCGSLDSTLRQSNTAGLG